MGPDRITRDEMLMNIAFAYAERGTCSRAKVGAVAARQGRVIVGAYNGAPAKMPHCTHHCDCYLDDPARHELIQVEDSHNPECNSRRPCLVSVHAEANAIAWTARNGGRLEGSHLFTTMAPCVNCAMLIINAGIYRVVCDAAYRDPNGVKLLQRAGVKVSQITPEGKTVELDPFD